MPEFYTSYNPPPSKAEPKCPKEIPDYILDVETGELVQSGTIPIYERIQSFYESTKLSTKLKRFSMGDSTALGFGNNTNSDWSGVPTDLREVLDSRKKINQDFGNLPADVRQLFNNDFDSFEKAVRDGTAERTIFDHLTKSAISDPAPAPETSD